MVKRMTNPQLRRRVLQYYNRCISFNMLEFVLKGPTEYPAMPESKQVVLIKDGRELRIGSVPSDDADNIEHMLREMLSYHASYNPEGPSYPWTPRDRLLLGHFDPPLDNTRS